MTWSHVNDIKIKKEKHQGKKWEKRIARELGEDERSFMLPLSGALCRQVQFLYPR